MTSYFYQDECLDYNIAELVCSIPTNIVMVNYYFFFLNYASNTYIGKNHTILLYHFFGA